MYSFGAVFLAIGLFYGLYTMQNFKQRDSRLDREWSDDEKKPYDAPVLSQWNSPYSRMIDPDRDKPTEY